MLCFYFLKRFYLNFLFFFVILTGVFAVSDLVVRLPLISSWYVTPKLLFLMLPLMSQFAIPLASLLAISVIIGNLHIEDEILFFYFSSRARRVLHFSVLIFSLTIVALYTPLVFVFAPQSYKKGKEFVVKFAKEQFYQLESNRFHTPASGITFFFKKKYVEKDRLIFEKLLLMFQEKAQNERYLINAKRGFLLQDNLFLEDGTIQNIGSSRQYFANFQSTEIDLTQFFDSEKSENLPKQLKFLTWKKLKKLRKYKHEAFMEFHKRISQILWQFLFPFFALWGMLLFSRKRSNMLISVAWSGALVLFSYI